MSAAADLKSLEFIHNEREESFRLKGYVLIDLLSTEEVTELRKLYTQIQVDLTRDEKTHFATGEHLEADKALVTSKAIDEIILPALNRHLVNYESLMSAFIVKPALQKAEEYFEWHQDLSFVDEEHNESAQLWVALQDTWVENGNIQIVEGTHSYQDNIRTSPSYPSFFGKYKEQMVKHCKQVTMCAGQALIFNHKLLHGSTPNQSSAERIAVISTLKPKGAEWLHFEYQADTKKVKKYAADIHFYLKKWSSQVAQPDSLIDSFVYHFPKMSAEQFHQWRAQHCQYATVFDRIRKLFK